MLIQEQKAFRFYLDQLRSSVERLEQGYHTLASAYGRFGFRALDRGESFRVLVVPERRLFNIGLGEFASGTEREVEYPVVSFGSVYEPLVKNGKLMGRFVIETAVSEILYADGTRWKRR